MCLPNVEHDCAEHKGHYHQLAPLGERRAVRRPLDVETRLELDGRLPAVEGLVLGFGARVRAILQVAEKEIRGERGVDSDRGWRSISQCMSSKAIVQLRTELECDSAEHNAASL